MSVRRLLPAAVLAAVLAVPLGATAFASNAAAASVTLDGTPPAVATSGSATFNYSFSAGATLGVNSHTFMCKLDSGAEQACGTADKGSQAYSSLADGSHTFTVYATYKTIGAATAQVTPSVSVSYTHLTLPTNREV